jgi:7-carboxy-7-deazaguanine synthase
MDRIQYPHVVLTGGEPAQQNPELMAELVELIKENSLYVQIETSGRFYHEYMRMLSWRTVSPKPPTYQVDERLLELADELKYVVDEGFDDSVPIRNSHAIICLQPEGNKPLFIQKTLSILKQHPTWRFSVQLHKLLRIP